MGDWTFFSNHGHVLVCLARDSEARLRDVAMQVGITERAVQKIVRDLQDAGYLEVSKHGRRNRYKINNRKALRHSLQSGVTIGQLLSLLNKPGGRSGATATPATVEAPATRPEPPAPPPEPEYSALATPEAEAFPAAPDPSPPADTADEPEPQVDPRSATEPWPEFEPEPAVDTEPEPEPEAEPEAETEPEADPAAETSTSAKDEPDQGSDTQPPAPQNNAKDQKKARKEQDKAADLEQGQLF